MCGFTADETAGIGLALHGNMLGHTLLSASPEAHSLSVTVASDRALTRELLVDFLRRHGFPQTNGQASLRGALGASARERPELVFVDLANDHEDARHQPAHLVQAAR